jgi:HlyD family secretion protein
MTRKRILIGVAVLAAVAVVAFLAFRGGDDSDNALTASGTVEATEADLGFQVGGRVASVNVREGDAVTAGQELARLDMAELEARRAAAEAQVQAAQALLAELRRGSRAAERGAATASVTAAAERLEEAQREYNRARALYDGGAISRQTRDQAETALGVARAQHEQLRQQSALVAEGPRAERITAQEAVVQQARAAVAQVTAALDNAVIRAPFAGTVSVRHREAGEAVSPGLPVVTVMNNADRWVRIYIPENRIGSVHIGSPATITSDTDPDRAYHGRVSFIAGEAEFTPRNVQTTEERVKLVYAVKVAITDDTRGDLKPGMPADVRLTPASQ